MTMTLVITPVTSAEQNCSILICDETAKAVIIDPGGDIEKLLDVLNHHDAEAECILITHGHPDHCAGALRLSKQLTIPIYGPHRLDQPVIQQLPRAIEIFDFPYADLFEPDRWLEHEDRVYFGEQELIVRHCPGHSPGHVIYIHQQEKLLWVGDILFKGSIGFYDYAMGDKDTLLKSIFEQIWPLGDDFTFVPGHGVNSTIGHERKTNPFVGDNTLAWMTI